jgi:hypothetical protein
MVFRSNGPGYEVVKDIYAGSCTVGRALMQEKLNIYGFGLAELGL